MVMSLTHTRTPTHPHITLGRVCVVRNSNCTSPSLSSRCASHLEITALIISHARLCAPECAASVIKQSTHLLAAAWTSAHVCHECPIVCQVVHVKTLCCCSGCHEAVDCGGHTARRRQRLLSHVCTCVYVGVYMLAGDPWIRTHEHTHARTADARNHNKP